LATTVEIGIFFIGRTTVDREEVRRWLDSVGVEDFTLPANEAVSDPALLIALAAKRCYKSFDLSLNPNLNRVRSDYAEYLDNVLKSGHGSVLEHSVYNLAIENVSRVFTAEMNRHRAGWAISEGSLRFIRFGENVPYWLPTSLRESESDDADLRERKAASRDVFDRAFREDESNYRELEKIWDMTESHHNFAYKKAVTSMMRRIIGLGVATGGVWSGNIRALRHVMTMRCEPAAEEEILHVFSRVVVAIREREPLLFGDFYRDDAGWWRPKYKKV
jgi:thymidylate synthase (FAD)